MRTVHVNLMFAFARLIAALLWIMFAATHSSESWGSYYFVASAIAGTTSLSLVIRDLGWPARHVQWLDWRDGLLFSLQVASFRVFRDAYKPIVAALSSFAAAGQYAAAILIADGAAMPISALSFATFVRFFRYGAHGTRKSLRLALRVLPFGLGLGLIGSVALAAIAPFPSQILGHSYIGTTTLILLVTPLPILYALLTVALDVLNSSGYLRVRAMLSPNAVRRDPAIFPASTLTGCTRRRLGDSDCTSFSGHGDMADDHLDCPRAA